MSRDSHTWGKRKGERERVGKTVCLSMHELLLLCEFIYTFSLLSRNIPLHSMICQQNLSNFFRLSSRGRRGYSRKKGSIFSQRRSQNKSFFAFSQEHKKYAPSTQTRYKDGQRRLEISTPCKNMRQTASQLQVLLLSWREIYWFDFFLSLWDEYRLSGSNCERTVYYCL